MRGGIGEEMRIPVGSASRRHKGVTMADLSFHGLELGFERKRHPRAIRPSCKDVLPGLQELDRQKREAYLIKNRQILRQGSMACLSINDVPVAFPSVIRIEDELAAAPVILTVQLRDGETLSPALVELQSGSNIKLVQLDSAVLRASPFSRDGKPLGDPSFKPLDILHDLKSPEGEDLKSLSGTRTSIVPDDAQMRSMRASVKTPHDTTNQAIRVVCFTDHALGEFLEDLMEIRVPGDQMVCLGGTSTALARPLTLLEQPGVNLQPSHWAQINTTKQRPQNHEHTRGHCQRRQGEVNRCTSDSQAHDKTWEKTKRVVGHSKTGSKMEWQRQKSQENAVNPAIDAVIEMAELEEVKSQILLIKAKVETSIRHGTDRNRSGSGSCTSKFLGQCSSAAASWRPQDHASPMVASARFKSTPKVLDVAFTVSTKHIRLPQPTTTAERRLLDFLLTEIETLVGHVAFVFAGDRTQMEKFCEHKPGLPSRMPQTLHFEDYIDAELLKMLQHNINKSTKGTMEIEGRPEGLYTKVAITVGEEAGVEKEGAAAADGYILNKEDLIGLDPSKAMETCDAWADLQDLDGLKNSRRGFQENPIIGVSLNRVFLGSPGTGTNSVAKIHGQIFADVGLLSNNEGSFLPIISSSVSVLIEYQFLHRGYLGYDGWKFLIIDEAYTPYPATGPGSGMFQNVNHGLARRSQLANAFRCGDLSDAELQKALEMKIEIHKGWKPATKPPRLPMKWRELATVWISFKPVDFDLGYDRASSVGTNLHRFFKGVIGCGGNTEELDGFLRVARGMQAPGLDPRLQIPMKFIFKGTPGTERQRPHESLGRFTLEKGLGEGLSFDKAHRLGEGHFASEAINEIVGLATKPKYAGKMIIVLAGYDQVVLQTSSSPGADSGTLSSCWTKSFKRVTSCFRDCKTLMLTNLGKSMLRHVFAAKSTLTLSPAEAFRRAEHALAGKLARNTGRRRGPVPPSGDASQSRPPARPPRPATGTPASAGTPQPESDDTPPGAPSASLVDLSPRGHGLDLGVCDAIRAQLEEEKVPAALAAKNQEQDIAARRSNAGRRSSREEGRGRRCWY
ncbi:hypothetical protein JHW43_003711 [Diplocarpon mali]|nr:hypothetical protein JHW43_003711 [Diplocarpon mali]